VTAAGAGKIHVHVEGLGDVVIDSAAVASRSPVPPPPSPPSPPSPWSGTLTGSVTHVSVIVPGLAGSTLGAQINGGVARATAHGALTLDGNLSYWRVEPAVAAANEWGLTLAGRRMLAPRWVLMGRSTYTENRVQYLKYRSTTLAGLGYYFVKTARVSLLVAPGVGYGKSEQTATGRVLSFAAGIPPGVEGAIVGVHDMLALQLTPALSFLQDMHYGWSAGGRAYRQADFNAKLLGMITKHFGLSIAFRDQYDTSMPAPVKRSLQSLVSGVQLKF
jgi:putative salt-induced outer membrane protein YdiY